MTDFFRECYILEKFPSIETESGKKISKKKSTLSVFSVIHSLIVKCNQGSDSFESVTPKTETEKGDQYKIDDR